MWREPEELLNLLNVSNDKLSWQIRQAAEELLPGFCNDISEWSWKEAIKQLCLSLVHYSTITEKKVINEGAELNDFKLTFQAFRLTPHDNFVLLLKLYRKAFIDILPSYFIGSKISLYSKLIDNFFDHLEITSSLLDSNLVRSEKPNKMKLTDSIDYSSLFKNLPAPVLLFDLSGVLVNYNDQAARLLKEIRPIDSSSNEIVDVRIINLFQFPLIDFGGSNEVSHSYQTSLVTNHGTRQFRVLLQKMTNFSGVSTIFIAMLEDITLQVETELNLESAKNKAEEADKLKTAFLANMSHEIRTPMNAILGFTELMLNEKFDNADRTEYLKLVRKSSNDLLNIIEDIIDIAKIESNQMKIKYKPCKPYDLLSDLKIIYNETLHRYGTYHDVELILQVDKSDQELNIYTDGERLKQVISNLLTNAVKFTNKGYIKFGFTRIDTSNLFFFVRDSGIGIPENMRERIFERFFQLEKTMALNVGGSGLGLAICRNIIKLMGGKIWVDSEEGKSSDFFFQIPCREVSLTSSSENVQQEFIDFPDWKDKRFLIAEDDEFNFIFLREIFQKTGACLIRARNGLEAIHAIETGENIDLVLMDIKMPEVDGLEATRYISRIKPEIPIIAQTAYAMESDRAKCINAGCCAYMTKPVDRQKLFQLIHHQLTTLQKKQIKQQTSSV
jgi:signal transduction histidine kinase/CheY-like chemotaxis protein